MNTNISAVIITKNESANLRRCLESIKWVDEIIVLDSGSEDDTCEIAKSYGAIVKVNEKWPGFGKQKQLAQSYATNDWILAIDADEAVSEELKSSITRIIQNQPTNTLYQIERITEVFGKFVPYSFGNDHIIRLYPRTLTQYNDAEIHENITVTNDMVVKPLSGMLYHYSYPNFSSYLKKSLAYNDFWVKDRKQRHVKSNLWKASTHSFACFIKMYIFKRGFLDGAHGFALSILSAQSVFNKYASLYFEQLNVSKNINES